MQRKIIWRKGNKIEILKRKWRRKTRTKFKKKKKKWREEKIPAHFLIEELSFFFISSKQLSDEEWIQVTRNAVKRISAGKENLSAKFWGSLEATASLLTNLGVLITPGRQTFWFFLFLFYCSMEFFLLFLFFFFVVFIKIFFISSFFL